MAISLEPGPLGPAVRGEALRLADRALDLLGGVRGERPEKAVHEARKKCKELRAVLRLVRPAMDEVDYRSQNDLFRDASRLLSPIRDTHAILETFDDLVGGDADRFAHPVGAVRTELRRRAMFISHRVGGDDPRVADAATLIGAGRQRVADWALPDDPEIALAGVHKIYRQGHDGLAASAAGGDVHVFHDWRKRVKYLWYHLQLLDHLAPDLLTPLAATVKVLSDTIGDGHDLYVLVEAVEAEPSRYGGADTVAALREVADARRADLEARALRLGRRLYADSPGTVRDRLRVYWDAHDAESGRGASGTAGGLDVVAPADDDLHKRSRAELLEVAHAHGIRGRWVMRKDELVLAVRAATAGERDAEQRYQ